MKKGVWAIGFAISLAIMLSAAGCGNSGGAASTASSQTNATGVELATVQVTIPLPSGSKNKAKGDAQPRKILAASQSFNVSVAGAGIATPITGTANKAVTGATTITLQVPVGTARTFTAKAFDAANATGNEISYGTATSDVVAGVNTVNMTLNVIPRAIASPVSAVTTAGTATTLAFTANDADAAAISNTPTTLINWTVVGGAANGAIDTNGVYTPPATYPGASGTVSQSVTVQTVSAVDATTPAVTAALTLNNPNGQVNVVFASVPTSATSVNAAAFGVAGMFHQITLLPNNKVLIFGGGTWDNVGCNITSQVANEFDVTAGTMTSVASTSIGRQYASSIALGNGKVITLGSGDACTASTNAKQLEIYDPVAQTWALGATSTNGFGASHPAILPNGKVLFAAGYWNHANRTYAELYDPTTGTFSLTGSLLVARQGGAWAVLNNGKYLMAGGTNLAWGVGTAAIAEAELYDPTAGTWSATGSMNAGRSFGGASTQGVKLNDGTFLVYGGSDGTNYLKTAEIYDPTTGTWSYTTGNLTYGRANSRGFLLNDGSVLIVGGAYDGTNTLVPGIELYNPNTKTFSVIGNLNVARTGPSAIELLDGRVLVVGGYSSTNVPLSSTEIITVQ